MNSGSDSPYGIDSESDLDDWFSDRPTETPEERAQRIWHENVPWNREHINVKVELPQYIVEALTHNQVISDGDLALINQYQRETQATISPLQQRIKKIEAAIKRLQQSKKELEEEAKPAQKILLACKISNAPFRRIPFEIHQMILSYCVAGRPSFNKKEPPLLLCRVSSIWRRVALSTPEIWREIWLRFNYETPLPRDLRKCLDFCASQLQSVSMSLHLLLPDPSDVSDDDEDDSSRWEEPLVPKFYKTVEFLVSWPGSNQIEYLHIHAPCLRKLLVDLDLHADAFHRLKYLTLRGCSFCHGRDHDINPVHTQSLLHILQAPNLKAISLGYDANLSWYAPPSSGPLRTSCVHGCILSPLDWFDSLQHQFIALQKGHFYFSQPAAGLLPIPVEDYSTLEELALTYGMIFPEDGPYDCFCPLRMFRFPILKRLQITLRSDNTVLEDSSPEVQGTIQELDDFSSCLPSLQELSLFCTWKTSTERLISLLDRFSNLTTLKLLVSNLEYLDFITFLTFHRRQDNEDSPSTTNRNLPNLSIVSLEIRKVYQEVGYVFDDDRANAFVKMVLSRLDPSVGQVALKSVYLVFLNYSSWRIDYHIDNMKDELVDAVDGGLFLVIDNSRGSRFCRDPHEAGLIHWEDGYIL